MATIYDSNGNTLSEGLQGSDVCDEAINLAKRLANERGETVTLEDDDGEWEIEPDGEDIPTPESSSIAGHIFDSMDMADHASVEVACEAASGKPYQNTSGLLYRFSDGSAIMFGDGVDAAVFGE